MPHLVQALTSWAWPLFIVLVVNRKTRALLLKNKNESKWKRWPKLHPANIKWVAGTTFSKTKYCFDEEGDLWSNRQLFKRLQQWEIVKTVPKKNWEESEKQKTPADALSCDGSKRSFMCTSTQEKGKMVYLKCCFQVFLPFPKRRKVKTVRLKPHLPGPFAIFLEVKATTFSGLCEKKNKKPWDKGWRQKVKTVIKDGGGGGGVNLPPLLDFFL